MCNPRACRTFDYLSHQHLAMSHLSVAEEHLVKSWVAMGQYLFLPGWRAPNLLVCIKWSQGGPDSRRDPVPLCRWLPAFHSPRRKRISVNVCCWWCEPAADPEEWSTQFSEFQIDGIKKPHSLNSKCFENFTTFGISAPSANAWEIWAPWPKKML